MKENGKGRNMRMGRAEKEQNGLKFRELETEMETRNERELKWKNRKKKQGTIVKIIAGMDNRRWTENYLTRI